MKTKSLIFAALLVAVGAGRAIAANSAAAKADSPVSVTYVDPQKFTDVKMDSWGRESTELLDQLQAFMKKTGGRYLPSGMHLDIKVTDIDLAGEFEPWRGPQFTDVRIIREIYMPRIALSFAVTDAKGNVVSSGERELTDQAFQLRTAWPQDDYLRYEKDMLRDWFQQEFGGLKQG